MNNQEAQDRINQTLNAVVSRKASVKQGAEVLSAVVSAVTAEAAQAAQSTSAIRNAIVAREIRRSEDEIRNAQLRWERSYFHIDPSKLVKNKTDYASFNELMERSDRFFAAQDIESAHLLDYEEAETLLARKWSIHKAEIREKAGWKISKSEYISSHRNRTAWKICWERLARPKVELWWNKHHEDIVNKFTGITKDEYIRTRTPKMARRIYRQKLQAAKNAN